MHLKYYFFSLFLTACLPTKTDHLIGESDRPGGEPDDPWVSTDTSVDGTPPTELEVDSDSIVITATNDPSEPSSPLMLSVDANKILHVEHSFEWDSSTVTDIQVTQPDVYTLDFDYGSSGETYIWLTIQYSIDISSLEAGTYSVTAEGDQDEFILE